MDLFERKKIINGLVWKFAERISSQGVSFVLSVLLARLLMPEEYGVVAMVQVFITIANVFVTSGFCTALIQKKDADELDFSTVFYCSMILSCALYAIIFCAAPFIADFYGIPQLSAITRVYALILLLYGYNSVQNAWVSRHMIFKKFFYATFSGTLVSGLAGVFLAYNGFGAWSIVAQALLNVFINMIVMKCIIPWRPKLIFSTSRAKSLMSFGGKVLGADLVGTSFNEMQQFIIGKMYMPADLAFFNRGKQFPLLITTNINSSIGAVLFPAMSNHSDDIASIKRLTRKSIQMTSYVMCFFMMLLIVVSEPLVRILLTEKWLPCVPYMRLICIANMVSLISTANLQAIKASGNGGCVFKLELYKKPVYLLLIVLASFHSVWAIAFTLPVYSVYSAVVNMAPNKKILGYSISEQIGDVSPSFLLAAVVGAGAFLLSFVVDNAYVLMIVQVAFSVLFYVLLSKFFKMDSFAYCVSLFKKREGEK